VTSVVSTGLVLGSAPALRIATEYVPVGSRRYWDIAPYATPGKTCSFASPESALR
jgi:hypothetical protein